MGKLYFDFLIKLMILSFGMVIAGSGGQDGKGRTHSGPQFQVKEIIIKIS